MSNYDVFTQGSLTRVSCDNTPDVDEGNTDTSNFIKDSGGCVRLEGGNIEKLGVTQIQSADIMPTNTIKYFSDNGAKPISKADATSSSIVDIPGIGRTTVGAAERLGLLDGDNSNTNAKPEANTNEKG